MKFSYVSRGQRIEIPTAEFHNAIVSVLNHYFKARRGFSSSAGNLETDFKGPRNTVCVTAHYNINPNSIFTISTDVKDFDPKYPTLKTAQVNGTCDPEILLVNDCQSMKEGEAYIVTILGDEEPYLITYSGDPPSIGDELGVLPGTFVVSKGYKGLIAISNADIELNQVWVVRYYKNQFELVKVEANECHYPGDGDGSGSGGLSLYTFNTSQCAWVDTELDVDVSDPEKRVMMLPGEKHFAIKFCCGQNEYFEFLGEFGLDRKAKTNDNIDVDQSGEVTIWQDNYQTGCQPSQSLCIVTACNNWGNTSDIPTGSEVFIRFYEDDWYIYSVGPKSFDELVLLKAKNCFYPGDYGTFDVYVIIADVPTDTGVDVTAYDIDYNNFLLPGEFIWAKESIGSRYDIVGSSGLKRGGVITNINAGVGTVDGLCDLYDVIVYTRYDDQTITCEGVATNCTLQDVCPPNSRWDRKWKVGERVSVWYDKSKRKWFLHFVPRAHHARTLLKEDLCWDQDAQLSDFVGVQAWYLDMAENCDYMIDPRPTSASNPFRHQGHAGDRILLLWDDRYDEWVVIDVEKHIYSQPVTDEYDLFIKYGNCQIDGNILPNIGLETCSEPAWVKQIQLYQRNIVEDIDQSGGNDPSGSGNITCPTISAMKGTACLFEDSNAIEEAVMEFQFIDVCVNITDDGTCVKAHYQAICVANYDSEEVTEDIICCQDCESGSGSGY